MGLRTSYPAGTFSWTDLAAADAAAAKAFYGALFGWEMDDRGSYTICVLGGDAVCGLYEMTDEMRATGAGPFWLSHVTVADADAVAVRARELGGAVVDDPFDVRDLGRMAVLRDPQGAVFAVWRPGRRVGAERVNDIGCLCMNELATTDVAAARPFYEGLFGWTTEATDEGPPMVFAAVGGSLNASMFDGEPAHWRPCFTVPSVERALERIRSLGGDVLAEPLELPDGAVATVRDPGGAVFSIFAGETDP
jgi:uncharacterized protein